VYPSNGAIGYQYNWQNSLGANVGTQQSVGNLAPGIYSVTVSVNSTGSCVPVTQTISIGSISVNTVHELKYFCGIESYFNDQGSNHHWYVNSVPINSATAGSFTLSPCSS